MLRTSRLLLNIIFFLQVLLLFLFFFEDRLSLPVWLQVAGRLHPALLHLPIAGVVFGVVLEFTQGQFKKKAFEKFSLNVLVLTSLSASITALMGVFLAQQGDYGADALTQHKNSGIVLSFLCYFLALTRFYAKRRDILYYGLGIVTAGTVVFAGHSGSELTHGIDFVLQPLRKSSPTEDANASAFQQVVYPILERKCTSCHNRTKAKGRLIMTSLEDLIKGGKNGKEWVPGKPAESRMIQYIHLPVSDDDHMPPDGKPQLTKQEIKLLESWIAAGADVEKKLTDLPEPDSFRILGTASLATMYIVQREEKTYPFSGADEESIKEMNTPFCSVFPLYQNSPALQADFFIRESFQSSSLERLKEVKEQLVVLNLSKMPVTDNDLRVIGTFDNLEKLNLNFTKIDGSGLLSLSSLRHLESLSLAGTSVTTQSLGPLLTMPSLRELFVWNTQVSEEDKVKLSATYPNVTIITTVFKDDQILRLSKPLLVNEGVLKKGDSVHLRHSMPGVTIRYTLDGINPDSIASSTYEQPFSLTTTSTLKAIACRQGWYCSEMLETTCFVEGLKPKGAHLMTPPDKAYPGEGDKSLTDGRKGFIEDFKEPSWLGYQNNPLAAAFEFDEGTPEKHSIVISYGKNTGSHIFPPEAVEVWAGRNSQDAKLIKSVKVTQPVAYDTPQISALLIPLPAAKHTYFKVVVKPVSKLPTWHSAKGKKGWVFVDEVFFY
ncbi:MAG: chitobiase/beta-hexosaminidase C-terminal domain-containing protein [Cyclobacteriaceae bacterium]|nr:chitobiase/beta-hexosaminidase C-terminal domain-containing protein [Cyclobacteriaceae bacterium]